MCVCVCVCVCVFVFGLALLEGCMVLSDFDPLPFSGSSQVAHGACEVPSLKVLIRGVMKEPQRSRVP